MHILSRGPRRRAWKKFRGLSVMRSKMLSNSSIQSGATKNVSPSRQLCGAHGKKFTAGNNFSPSGAKYFPACTRMCKEVRRKKFHARKKIITTTAQSGFRPGPTCETALLRIVDMWAAAMDRGGVNYVRPTKGVRSHLSRVSVGELRIYQCDDNSSKWFRSYLTDRTQQASVKGHLSETALRQSSPRASLKAQSWDVTLHFIHERSSTAHRQ